MAACDIDVPEAEFDEAIEPNEPAHVQATDPADGLAPVDDTGWDDASEAAAADGDGVDDVNAGGAEPAGFAEFPVDDIEDELPEFQSFAPANSPLPKYRLRQGATARSLGVASAAFPVVGAQLVGGKMYMVSRNLTPARMVAFDLATRRVAAGDAIAVPTGVGAWGMTSSDSRRLYFAQYGAPGRGNLFRVDPSRRPLTPTAVAALDALYVWALDAAPNGVVYGVASRENGSNFVFDYNPTTNRASVLPVIAQRDVVRSVAASDEYVFHGGATPTPGAVTPRGAILRATNRRTGATVRLFHTQINNDSTVYTLRRTGSLLAAGTAAAPGGRAALAVLDLRTNAARVVRAGNASDRGTARAELIDAIAIAGNTVYFTARPSGTLYRYDVGSNASRSLGTPVARSETRGLFMNGSVLVGASAEGSVWTYDTRSGRRARHDLLASGVRGSGELAQSVVSDGRRVYVGGNFGVQARTLSNNATYRFFVPGEAKDMAVAEGNLYMAMYPVGEIWSHRPGTTRAQPVVQLPAGQHRPTAIRFAADRRALLVGVAVDSGGGGLHRYDLANRRLASKLDPFARGGASGAADRQSVTSLAYDGGIAYIGGGHAPAPRIAAYDVATLTERWRLDNPAPEAGGIIGMVVRGGRLYGYTTRGTMIVVDIARRAVTSVRRADSAGGGRLALSGGQIFGVNENTLRRFDPTTGTSTVLAENLAGGLWGFPCIAGESDGSVYVIERSNLLRVRP